jgi:hypothetical protein
METVDQEFLTATLDFMDRANRDKLMDVDQPAALPFPQSLPEFSAALPGRCCLR